MKTKQSTLSLAILASTLMIGTSSLFYSSEAEACKCSGLLVAIRTAVNSASSSITSEIRVSTNAIMMQDNALAQANNKHRENTTNALMEHMTRLSLSTSAFDARMEIQRQYPGMADPNDPMGASLPSTICVQAGVAGAVSGGSRTGSGGTPAEREEISRKSATQANIQHNFTPPPPASSTAAGALLSPTEVQTELLILPTGGQRYYGNEGATAQLTRRIVNYNPLEYPNVDINNPSIIPVVAALNERNLRLQPISDYLSTKISSTEGTVEVNPAIQEMLDQTDFAGKDVLVDAINKHPEQLISRRALLGLRVNHQQSSSYLEHVNGELSGDDLQRELLAATNLNTLVQLEILREMEQKNLIYASKTAQEIDFATRGNIQRMAADASQFVLPQ